eukprot:COSAG05_NODE_101_length_19100_cov_24.260144_13_plen_185_part_00
MLIGIMGSMMVGNKLLEEKVQTQLVELREFMQHRGIPKPLRARVRKYMETLYEQRSGFNEREILMQLPPALAQELLSSMYRPVVEEIPMFAGALRPCSHALRLPAAPSHWPVLLTPLMMHSLAGLREEALTQLCMLLKPFLAMAGDVVYRRGEVGRELYLHWGSINPLRATRAEYTCGYPLGFT